VPAPFTLDELAALARVRVEDVEEYRSRGLLDPDRDGVLDEMDVLRLRILMHYLRVGYTLDDLEKAIREGSQAVLYSDLLFSTDGNSASPEQAAEETGLTVAEVNAFRRAIGLSGPIPRDDLKFFSAVKGLMDEGVDMKVLSDVARVYGETMRRLAQTEVRMIRSFIGEPGKSSVLKDRQQSERLESVQQVVAPILEPLLLNIHRQHLMRASVLESLAALEAEEKGTDAIEATIVFLDLVAFTPFAQVHGDEVAADVLDTFDTLVRDCLEGHTGNLVKQIGDAIMLAFPDAGTAAQFAVALDRTALETPQFPALRAGLHHGPVLYRVGDYVGHTVNLAARIAAAARPHEILVTEPVARAAESAGLRTETGGSKSLAGVDDPVELWRLVWLDDDAARGGRDPVCGISVGDDAAAHLVYGGIDYAFCSPECLRRFIEDPELYTLRQKI
jgi:class 3 adenylate cyclase/YHS domain-containing protein/DNA-binding transcriptional MerR regulator